VTVITGNLNLLDMSQWSDDWDEEEP